MTRLRLMLDQMMDATVAYKLREIGYDILRTEDVGMARMDDAAILRMATKDDRILITLDEHFGDWTVLPLSQHPGVVRIKAHPTSSAKILEILVPFLNRHSEHNFTNQLVIVSERKVRWINTAGKE